MTWARTELPMIGAKTPIRLPKEDSVPITRPCSSAAAALDTIPWIVTTDPIARKLHAMIAYSIQACVARP